MSGELCFEEQRSQRKYDYKPNFYSQANCFHLQRFMYSTLQKYDFSTWATMSSITLCSYMHLFLVPFSIQLFYETSEVCRRTLENKKHHGHQQNCTSTSTEET
ncbi:hypothetical protein ILYODFUR_015255 [Ilyodon furcidens]|uniref:Uncharacterized protein n=1 Tax=Ilyodon furcidens TaxID=33524 RepID=A0ABV0UJD3_9TELE